MARDEDKNNIDEIFPELNTIESDDLREQTLCVWDEALQRGGWQPNDLYRIPASLHLLHLDISLVEHTRAVTKVALMAAEVFEEHYPETAYELNQNYLVSGGLLHDVGKVLEYVKTDGRWQKSADGLYVRHPFSGVAICDKHDIPPEIQQMVAFHSHEGDFYDRIPETIVLSYADSINFDTLLSEYP